MDKAKVNFVIIGALVVLCVVIIGYAASLNAQLGAEKTKTMQLNDRIAGLNSKVNDLNVQLTGVTTQANEKTMLLNNLQSSLGAAMAEIDSLKTLKAELESKLQSAISNVTSQVTEKAQQAVTGTASSVAPLKQ
ncbi:MAG: hypothetical protein Q7O04_07560 [Candidatus Omnitrophota bacterium]|nr:hypothetical protein [Candidatus Omnitrophota bacterium]